jgi:cell division protein FtsB
MDRWPINPRRVAVFVGMLVLVLMVVDFNARLEELNLLKKHASGLGEQATQAVQTQTGLETQVAYAASNQAVEDWARSEGHLVQPGDQPVVPVGQPGSAPLQQPAPTPVPTPMANWQIWWKLFFGE